MPTRKRKSKKQRKRKRDKDTDSSGDETPVEMPEDLLNRNASGPKKDRTDADVQKKSSENTPADKSGCKGKRGENIEASAVEASAATAGRVLLVCLRVLVIMLLCSGACSRYQARLLTRRRRERSRRCQKMWRLR